MAVLVMMLMMTGCGQVAEESREDTPFPVAQEITAGQENNAEQTKTAKQEEFAGNAADERSSFLLSSNGRFENLRYLIFGYVPEDLEVIAL